MEMIKEGSLIQIQTATGPKLVEVCKNHPHELKPCPKCGQDLSFENEEELITKIEQYVEECKGGIKEVEFVHYDTDRATKDPTYKGEIRTKLQKVKGKPLTMSGLAKFLGVTRETIIRLSEDHRFYRVLNRAKTIIEEYAEKELFREKGQTGGVKFALQNNHGWKDKQEVDLNASHSFSLSALHEEYERRQREGTLEVD